MGVSLNLSIPKLGLGKRSECVRLLRGAADEPGGARNRERTSSRDRDSSRTRVCGSVARKYTRARARIARLVFLLAAKITVEHERKKSRGEIAIAFHITMAEKYFPSRRNRF